VCRNCSAVIYNDVKPKPPFSQQFAAKEHTHADLAALDHSHDGLLAIPSLEQQKKSCAKEA
jgi:hypothetical protein